MSLELLPQLRALMSRPMSIVLIALGAVLALVGGLALWARLTEHRPEAVEPVEVECRAPGRELEPGVPFKVVSWNLQYGASRKHRFFYDGGDTVQVPRSDVEDTVRAISEALTDYSADIALLQEIDRGSKRTHEIDQLTDFARGARANCIAAATYHRSPFVPMPPTDPMGKVDMNLGLLTRATLSACERVQLPLLDEPWIRQAFNLKRALLSGEVAVRGGRPLKIAVTHLSAFSHGDGTLDRQVARLEAWMSRWGPDQPWILAGDFNLLPPGDDKSRLSAERDLYADATNPIERLIPKFTEVFSDPLSPRARTYLPYGATQPDRKIDYFFVGGPIRVRSAHVDRSRSDLSDHLPLVVELELTEGAPGAPRRAFGGPPGAVEGEGRDADDRRE